MISRKEKANIRLKKVYQRLCKNKYPDCPNLRKLVRLNEQQKSYSRWMSKIWDDAIKYGGFKAGIDNDNPKFYPYFDELAMVEGLMDKATKKILAIEKKGYSMEEALRVFSLINRGRLSTSF